MQDCTNHLQKLAERVLPESQCGLAEKEIEHDTDSNLFL